MASRSLLHKIVLLGNRSSSKAFKAPNRPISSLRGRTSGFAIPTYVLDTPYGKVPIQHPYARGRDGDDYVVEAWDGRVWREPNPQD